MWRAAVWGTLACFKKKRKKGMHSPMRCGRFPRTTNQAKALCARGWNDQDSHPPELWSTGPSKSTVVPPAHARARRQAGSDPGRGVSAECGDLNPFSPRGASVTRHVPEVRGARPPPNSALSLSSSVSVLFAVSRRPPPADT